MIERTEEGLLALLGQQESVRLEFKESSIFEQPKEKYLSSLSTVISSLANTEGGQIVIGIREERKGRTRVAGEIDAGIDPSLFPPEWFQQALESRISPHLLGLRFIRVPLKSSRPGRVAIVIDVPKGTTAYQADDKRYYGRSEFESKPLADNEIRLRMLRPRVAIGTVQARPLERSVYGEESQYPFVIEIHNVGELTIRGFILEVRFSHESNCPLTSPYTTGAILQDRAVRFSQIDDSAVVMPGDSIVVNTGDLRVGLPTRIAFSDTALGCAWKLFLDDAPANTGVIDIASLDFPVRSPIWPKDLPQK